MRLLLLLLTFLLVTPTVWGSPEARIAELIRATTPKVPESLADRERDNLPAPAAAPARVWRNSVYVFMDARWSAGSKEIRRPLWAAFADMAKYDIAFNETGTPDGTPHIIVVDRIDARSPPNVVTDILGEDWTLPAMVAWKDGTVRRSWSLDCGRPVDAWLLHWLMTGTDPRPVRYTMANGGLYPRRGGLWSVDGSYAPPHWKIEEHMLESAAHGGHFDSEWIADLEYDELMSLHSDEHEGRIQWRYVFKPGTYAMSRLVRPPKATPAAQQRPALQLQSCPNGKCPSPSRRW
jgi:hypothetical protein